MGEGPGGVVGEEGVPESPWPPHGVGVMNGTMFWSHQVPEMIQKCHNLL